MRIRVVYAVLVVVSAALGACNGWPRAIAYDEAEHKPEKYITYTAAPAEQVQIIELEQRRWMIAPTHERFRGKLQQIGSAGSTAVYAQQGISKPYSVLYAPAANGEWRKIVPID